MHRVLYVITVHDRSVNHVLYDQVHVLTGFLWCFLTPASSATLAPTGSTADPALTFVPNDLTKNNLK